MLLKIEQSLKLEIVQQLILSNKVFVVSWNIKTKKKQKIKSVTKILKCFFFFLNFVLISGISYMVERMGSNPGRTWALYVFVYPTLQIMYFLQIIMMNSGICY